jgi:4-aminobutyrate aminotransferase-like enzyme
MKTGDGVSRLLSTSLTTGKAAVPTVVSGSGARFRLADGREVIDGSNTAAPLGHQHPELVQALRDAAEAPAVNEGWGWKEREFAADALVRTAFGDADWVGAVRFFMSASEANDAALALAQALTGRRDLATRERAYHGGSGLAREMTVQPQWHGGLSRPTGGVRPVPALVSVHILPAPSGARVTGQPDPTAGDEWLAAARTDLSASAAVILDYSQGGIYHSPAYQDRVAALARESGALWIADETVTGFGRTGGWFQFEKGASRPDMVTMGKSLAGGSAPAGALVLSRDVVAEIGPDSWQTYSTFRGHPAAMAAIQAHLRVSQRDRIPDRAVGFDEFMRSRLAEIASEHRGVARVDGRGLHWTVELHGPDWRRWRGEEAEPLASQVARAALDQGVLLSTSAEQTSLFIAPPLVIQEADLSQILDVLDSALSIADDNYGSGEIA